MSNYSYEAEDASGLQKNGTLDVLDQSEALRRIKQMGLFPLNVKQAFSAQQKKLRNKNLFGCRRG